MCKQAHDQIVAYGVKVCLDVCIQRPKASHPHSRDRLEPSGRLSGDYRDRTSAKLVFCLRNSCTYEVVCVAA